MYTDCNLKLFDEQKGKTHDQEERLRSLGKKSYFRTNITLEHTVRKLDPLDSLSRFMLPLLWTLEGGECCHLFSAWASKYLHIVLNSWGSLPPDSSGSTFDSQQG